MVDIPCLSVAHLHTVHKHQGWTDPTSRTAQTPPRNDYRSFVTHHIEPWQEGKKTTWFRRPPFLDILAREKVPPSYELAPIKVRQVSRNALAVDYDRVKKEWREWFELWRVLKCTISRDCRQNYHEGPVARRPERQQVGSGPRHGELILTTRRGLGA